MKARLMMRLRPSASTSGPPNTIASVKPQKAEPLIQPACSLVRLNCETHSAVAAPRKAKLMAVTISATQLALNSLEEFIASFLGVLLTLGVVDTREHRRRALDRDHSV